MAGERGKDASQLMAILKLLGWNGINFTEFFLHTYALHLRISFRCSDQYR